MNTTHDASVTERAVAEAPFQISRRRWRRLLAGLASRGQGHRESGAFLLADKDGHQVRAVAYYDDLDANCLTGGISLASIGFTKLWEICGASGLKVVADVHTHTGRGVEQSHIDATNPMIARRGHVAIIVPEYGRASSVRACGVHIYLGSHQWIQVRAEEVGQTVHLYGVLSRAQLDAWKNAFHRLFTRARGGQP